MRPATIALMLFILLISACGGAKPEVQAVPAAQPSGPAAPEVAPQEAGLDSCLSGCEGPHVAPAVTNFKEEDIVRACRMECYITEARRTKDQSICRPVFNLSQARKNRGN